MMRILMLLCASLPAMAAGFRAGAAKVDITPKEPVWMSGYASRNRPFESVRAPLFARALAIDTGSGKPVVIIATDLVGLSGELADEVAGRLKGRFGLERERVLLNSSHTHTGPVVWPNLAAMWDLPAGEESKLRAYAERLKDDLTTVASQAIADLAPANLAFAFGEAGFAVNRREPTARGVRIGVNPAGPVDRQVPVIRITSPNGKVRAVLFAYACHNTTLTGEFYQLSGDYAGVAEAQLEKEYPGATALFLELCGGDQNPNPRSTIELAEQHGGTLAAEVKRVLHGQMREMRPPLRTSWVMATLPFAPQEKATFEAELANPKSTPAARNRARKMLDKPVTSIEYPVQALRFGDLTLVALGGEAVVDYGLRIKRENLGRAMIVAAYSNSVMCYIPTEQVLREGGYEAVDNLVYYGQPGPFAPGVEERVMAATRQAVKAVGK